MVGIGLEERCRPSQWLLPVLLVFQWVWVCNVGMIGRLPEPSGRVGWKECRCRVRGSVSTLIRPSACPAWYSARGGRRFVVVVEEGEVLRPSWEQPFPRACRRVEI